MAINHDGIHTRVVVCLQACAAAGACIPLLPEDSDRGAAGSPGDGSLAPLRSRSCSAPGSAFQAPLVVSGPRRVAALFSSNQRALALDLEEDEEEEGEEGGGEEEEGEGREGLVEEGEGSEEGGEPMEEGSV